MNVLSGNSPYRTTSNATHKKREIVLLSIPRTKALALPI